MRDRERYVCTAENDKEVEETLPAGLQRAHCAGPSTGWECLHERSSWVKDL